MKALILAAGYGARLYPLTQSMPKSLLDVNGKPMMEYVLERIKAVPNINEFYVVGNEKFNTKFKEWKEKQGAHEPIKLLNDGTTDNKNKLGAIRDIELVLSNEKIDSDILIVASDNLFDFDLEKFYEFFKRKKSFCIGLFRIDDPILVRRYSNVTLDKEKRIIDFVEKPTKALSNLVAICLYIFPKERLHMVRSYLEEGNNPDAPGYFMQWLIAKEKVYGYEFSGKWLDIGDINSYNKAKEEFKSISNS